MDSSEIKEEEVPSTPTEKQLKELDMFVHKHSQMSKEASTSSAVVVAAEEPQPTIAAEEPQPTIAADEPQPRISRRPRNWRFLQQELTGCRRVPTSKWNIAILTFVGLLFIPIGIAALIASNNVVEVSLRYDDTCLPFPYNHDHALAYIKDAKTNKTCGKGLVIEKKMKAPIYVYYQLDNFHQNHRQYVKSRSDKQLRSKEGENDVTSCGPKGYTENDEPIVLCGLIAWSLFNDTYKISRNMKELVINKKGIAWKSDKVKFGSDVYPKHFQTEALIGGGKLDENIPLSEQEDLIVWMRMAAMPTFRKLYGKIEVDLEARDKILIVIENNYNSYEFQGKKTVVLSTTTWIGGKNNFLGISYIAIGGICLLFSLIYTVLCMIMPEPVGAKSLFPSK